MLVLFSNAEFQVTILSAEMLVVILSRSASVDMAMIKQNRSTVVRSSRSHVTYQLVYIYIYIYIYCDVFTPATIVETQKSANTLRNNRGSGVFSVPCRAEPHRALLHDMPR
jgi:hypothetical protein